MHKCTLIAAAVLAAGTAAATATPVLQFDLNGFGTQAHNASGASSPFGGLTHTGSVAFSIGTGQLVGIFIQSTSGGAFLNAGFSGFTMTNFSGQVNLVAGQVTGGSITVTLNNGDNYTCGITP